MITIYKGNQKATVPSGSYKSMFKPYGWTTRKPKRGEEPPVPPVPPQPPVPPEENTSSRGDKTTLEGMSEQELRQYAALVKVNVKGLKTREELLEALKGKE